jgi:hypothetical protein
MKPSRRRTTGKGRRSRDRREKTGTRFLRGKTMKEKRTEKRLQLARYLKIYDQASGMFIGHMVDIHLRGMLMVSERPILPGSELNLGLEIFTEKMPLTLEAIWCEEDTGLESYNIGCRIVDLPGDTETCIRALMEALENRN